MKTIIILNSKGGVGKTNVTRHLAVAAEQENPGKVVICDTDPQGSLVDWWNARESNAPSLAMFKLSEYADKKEILAEKFSYIFFDTASANSKEFDNILSEANLILIPIIPTADDLRSLGKITLPAVKKSGRPFVFVVSKARAGTVLLSALVQELSEAGPVCPTVIQQREGYARAATTGLTILEWEPDGKGSEEVRQLWEFIKEQIHPENKKPKIKKDILYV